jgi:hypothetical protein
MREYYRKNKHKWPKRTNAENIDRNADRRKRYAEDTAYREATKAKVRKYCKANSDVVKSRKAKALYGITEEEHAKIFANQLGVCAICEQEPSGSGANQSLHVDHDHETGKIRGLLCGNCNHGLGKFKDSKKLMVRAYLYLESQGGNP